MNITQTEIKNETVQRVFDMIDSDGFTKFDEIESVDLVKMLFQVESQTPDAISITKGLITTVGEAEAINLQSVLTNQDILGVIWRFTTSHKFMIELSKIPSNEGNFLCLTLIYLVSDESLSVRELVRFNKNQIEYTDRRMRSVDYSPASIKMLLCQSEEPVKSNDANHASQAEMKPHNPFKGKSLEEVATLPYIAPFITIRDKMEVWYANRTTPDERKELLIKIENDLNEIRKVNDVWLFIDAFPEINNEINEKLKDLKSRNEDDLRYQKKEPPKPTPPPEPKKEPTRYHAKVEVSGDLSEQAVTLIRDTIEKQIDHDFEENNHNLDGIGVDQDVINVLQDQDSFGKFKIVRTETNIRNTDKENIKDFVVTVFAEPIKRYLHDVVISCTDGDLSESGISLAKSISLVEIKRSLDKYDGKVIIDDEFKFKISNALNGLMIESYEAKKTEDAFHNDLTLHCINLKRIENNQNETSDEEKPYEIKIDHSIGENNEETIKSIKDELTHLIDSGNDNPVMVQAYLEREFSFKFEVNVTEDSRPVWSVYVSSIENTTTQKKDEEEMDNTPTFEISEDVVKSFKDKDVLNNISSIATKVLADREGKTVAELCEAIKKEANVKCLALFEQEDGFYYIDLDDTEPESEETHEEVQPTVDIKDPNIQMSLLKGLFGTTDPSAMHVETYLKNQLTDEDDKTFLATNGSLPSIYTAVWNEKPWDLTVSIVKMMNGRFYRIWVAQTNVGLAEHDWISTKDIPDRWVQLGRDIQNVSMRSDRNDYHRGYHRR